MKSLEKQFKRDLILIGLRFKACETDEELQTVASQGAKQLIESLVQRVKEDYDGSP